MRARHALLSGLILVILLCVAAHSSPAHSASVDLAWDASAGSDGYNIYYGIVPGIYDTPLRSDSDGDSDGDLTTFTLSGLTDGTTYYIAVTSTLGDPVTQESGYSTEIAFNSAREVIAVPTAPSGPGTGSVGVSYSYSTWGASSSQGSGHTIQYRFSWGDGSDSGWLPVGTTSANHSWTGPGLYDVQAEARCSLHTTVVSNWSVQYGVDISGSGETISTPTTPTGSTGGTAGEDLTFSSGGATSSAGHSVEYRFTWGEGTNSSWLPVGTMSTDGSWSVPGTYSVSVEARCKDHHHVLSDYSPALSVTIAAGVTSETVSTPNVPTGPSSGVIECDHRFTAGGSNSSQGHAVEYRFSWGDGTISAWGTTKAKGNWSLPGIYGIQVEARCATDNSALSIDWSNLFSFSCTLDGQCRSSFDIGPILFLLLGQS
jgi:hypothetical protein